MHRTDPEAGTVVAEGTVIELYYNPTKALVTVPNVAGRSIEEARALLGESGFQFTEETELSDVPKGLVIRTDPAGDARVPQETVITVFVSGGPNQVSIPPTVINDEVDVARSLLESAEYGLKVEIQQQVDPVIPAGVVISTNPPPNTLVDKGSTVTLIVSSGPGQERVPPLVGLTEGQARNLLDDRGFGIEVTYRELPPGDSTRRHGARAEHPDQPDGRQGNGGRGRGRPGARRRDHHHDEHDDHHHDDHDAAAADQPADDARRRPG